MTVNSKFENVVDFRRALNNFAVKNEFNYYIQKSDPTRFTTRCENLECEWRIHASVMQDEVTIEVQKMVEVHTCTRSNKGGNKRVTQGCIANVVTAKLKYDGDISPIELRNWIMKTYNVDVSYLKVLDVVNMDTVKRHVKIPHLNVSIEVKHTPLKGYSNFPFFH
ncbi:unnamed protein product [Lactuca virosa]|uniref:Transposase MuDR plant domain-containing protein n=1 Tax=Lactuca virosa TaxID=75947 RepID=A0AAU9PKX8_9ASTR|nr:unnamed protein product [Lactuca virosa]